MRKDFSDTFINNVCFNHSKSGCPFCGLDVSDYPSRGSTDDFWIWSCKQCERQWIESYKHISGEANWDRNKRNVCVLIEI